MSAFAVIYERSNMPVDPNLLGQVMKYLSHRGPDGQNILQTSQVSMGHWHFWVTPEEVGEKQPLEIDGFPFKLVLDGRLDNRSDLLNMLQIDPRQGKSMSDAILLLHAYARWGEGCLNYLLGEFALVIWDELADKLVCARDALGDRTLFYASYGTKFVIASEPWAVAMAGNSFELHEGAVAHYFALKAPQDGQTLFKGVFELLPAHLMVVKAATEIQERYWQPNFQKRLSGKSDKEYAEQFLFLLDESVRCRLRSASPVGVLMSGGLDSTSVACLAARELAPTVVTTISLVFNELVECDERQYIDVVKKYWNLDSIQIPGDGAWPLRDWQNWPYDPNLPNGNPSRLLNELAYQCAQQHGIRVLLTGVFGDHLYGGAHNWFADLLAEGRWQEAAQELTYHIQSLGVRRVLRSNFLRRTARRIIDTLPGSSHLHRRSDPPAWLTPLAGEYFKQSSEDELFLGNYNNLLGLRTAQAGSLEIFNTSRHSLELRHPYRDRRLIEFVLMLPGYQLYFHGVLKIILRNAMKDILPELVRDRLQPTSHKTLYFRGLEREIATVQDGLQFPGSDWPRFVRRKWLPRVLDDTKVLEQNKAASFHILWLCLSYAAWYKSHNFSKLQLSL